MIDIWEYKFCIGQSIDQYNTKNYSEFYNIGSLAEPMNATGIPLPQGGKPLANFEFPLNEQLEIDGSGMVFRTVIKPRFTERFLAPQLE